MSMPKFTAEFSLYNSDKSYPADSWQQSEFSWSDGDTAVL